MQELRVEDALDALADAVARDEREHDEEAEGGAWPVGSLHGASMLGSATLRGARRRREMGGGGYRVTHPGRPCTENFPPAGSRS